MNATDWTKGWESLRLIPYWDGNGRAAQPGDLPNGTLTCGFGHTGNDVVIGQLWTQARAEAAFEMDDADASDAVGVLLSLEVSALLNEARFGCLQDLAFELGQTGLGRFRLMLSAVTAGNWEGAAHQLLLSKYAKQTPRRATANADVMLSGEWPAVHPNDPEIV